MLRNYKAVKNGNRSLAARKTSKKYCPDCGFKIRGTKENHEKGIHHRHGRDGKAEICKSR